MFETGTATV